MNVILFHSSHSLTKYRYINFFIITKIRLLSNERKENFIENQKDDDGYLHMIQVRLKMKSVFLWN